MTTVSGYYQLECEIRRLKEKAESYDRLEEFGFGKAWQEAQKEIKQLKEFLRIETKEKQQLLHDYQNLKQKLEQIKPIIKDELEMWTSLEKIEEDNSTSLKETFQKLKEILDSQEKE